MDGRPISSEPKETVDVVEAGQPKNRFSAWSQPVSKLKFPDVTAPGVTNLNVDGRKVSGPMQGFGQLWQKTFKVRLTGVQASPQEIIQIWKENFPRFHARENRFYTSKSGIAPGEVLLINAMTPGGPVSTGMLVIYVDEESFTLMTPEGHPESGWVTFSVEEDDSIPVAQVQTMARANDPIYELAFMVMGSKLQDSIWMNVLQSLSRHFNVTGVIQEQKVLIDNKRQWKAVKNTWKNAQIRTILYSLTAPGRWMGGLFRRKSKMK